MTELEGVRFGTPNGPGDAEAGFALFGLVPVAGARFEIDHPALRAPGVKRIRLGLEWVGLPPTGFSSYYAGYAPFYAVRNDSFRIIVRAPGFGEGREMPLFPGSAEGAADPVSWFDLRAEQNCPAGPDESPIALVLASPADAFGNTIYPVAVMAAAIKGAEHAKHAGPIGWLGRLFGRQPAAPAMPNMPWLPIAKVHVSVG